MEENHFSSIITQIEYSSKSINYSPSVTFSSIIRTSCCPELRHLESIILQVQTAFDLYDSPTASNSFIRFIKRFIRKVFRFFLRPLFNSISLNIHALKSSLMLFEKLLGENALQAQEIKRLEELLQKSQGGQTEI